MKRSDQNSAESRGGDSAKKKFSYAIGYVKQTKFIKAAYNVSKNANFDIELLLAEIPNEEDNKRYWCNRKNKN